MKDTIKMILMCVGFMLTLCHGGWVCLGFVIWVGVFINELMEVSK